METKLKEKEEQLVKSINSQVEQINAQRKMLNDMEQNLLKLHGALFVIQELLKEEDKGDS